MVTKVINLNLKDQDVTQIIYVSQYDSGLRAFRFQLFDGIDEWIIPENASVEFRGRKPDRYGFMRMCSYNANIVTCDCTEQMTAVAGESYCKLAIVDTLGNRIASFHIIMCIDPDPITDTTIISDSEISYIQQMLSELGSVAALVQKINNIACWYVSEEEQAYFTDR